MKSVLIFLFFLTHGPLVQAQSYRRLVNFEWETIEGASKYEIEIRKKGQAKANLFKSVEPAWSGRLQVGHYEFRLRTLDQRQVPGEWSGYADLDVMLEPVKIKSPAPQANLKSVDEEKIDVLFEWEAVPDAKEYILTVKNLINEVIAEEKTESLKKEISLKSAAQYTYQIKAVQSGKIESESVDAVSFTIVGPRLAKAQIERPENEFIREVKWQKVDNAENYDVILAKLNPTTKKWQKFKEFVNYNALSLNFESDWPGGKYKLLVKSKAAIREHSETSAVSFDVRTGDRSPAAEYVTTMRKSIERANGWFTHLSWYASSISLNSKYKNSLNIQANTITGTGRVGVGWLDPDRDWGLMTIADIGGFVFENSIYNFVGIEISAIRKQEVSDRADVRYHMGAFLKEFPALWTTSSSASANFGNENNVDRKYGKGAVLGPHVGVEYWYSMTPRLGLQGNLHMYLPVSGVEFPNGGKISNSDPNLSIGALASYSYSKRLTGLIGLNYRMESYNYTDSADRTGWITSPNGLKFNDTVITTLDGIYLNLMAEYAF